MIDLITIALFGLFGVAEAFMFFMLMRNNQVHELRLEMLDIIFKCNDWQWRLVVKNSVKYEEMVYKFWLPVKAESFYKTQHFLNPSSRIL